MEMEWQWNRKRMSCPKVNAFHKTKHTLDFWLFTIYAVTQAGFAIIPDYRRVTCYHNWNSCDYVAKWLLNFLRIFFLFRSWWLMTSPKAFTFIETQKSTGTNTDKIIVKCVHFEVHWPKVRKRHQKSYVYLRNIFPITNSHYTH